MGYWRKRAIDERAIRVDTIANGAVWPAKATQFADSYRNQFEMPVLFYVLTVLAIMTRHADLVFVVLAWVWVVMRLMQAYVHVTDNNVKMRGLWFGVSAIVLMIMWAIFIVRILLGLP